MIYFDHHAATPLSEAAQSAMEAARLAGWANPASVHAQGQRARALLENAREQVSSAVGARRSDVILTSGGTEACNLGIRGLINQPGRPLVSRIATTTIEHPAVGAVVDGFEEEGASVSRCPVPEGRPPPVSTLMEGLGEGGLLAIQWVNHETGTILPAADYARAARERGALVFVDATQALGKLGVSVDDLGADAVAFAAHKIGGPAGAGCLWVRRGVTLSPLLLGGEQERGRRPGCPDVAAIAGFGAACTGIGDRLRAMPRIAAQRGRLEGALVSMGATVNGTAAPRVSTVTNASVKGWKGEAMVAALDLEGLCASSGAACSSGTSSPSAVLSAMYPDEPWRAQGALRLSLGPETTEDDIERCVAILETVLARAV